MVREWGGVGWGGCGCGWVEVVSLKGVIVAKNDRVSLHTF